MSADGLKTPPALWPWPMIDQPVEIDTLILREWKHDGDSPIIAARPRKQRGGPMPDPTYFVKVGRDAIGERLYSLAAKHFGLPSTVVSWTTAADLHEAAIRFEPDAWRPARIDPEQGIAASEGRTVLLQNPLDYYRHLALSDVLGEGDGTEYLVCRERLVRIDAAHIGWTLFSEYMGYVLHLAERGSPPPPEGLSPWVQVSLEHLPERSPAGYHAYRDMLAQIVAWDELPTVLAADLRTCPASAHSFVPAVAREMLLQQIPSFADVVETSLRQHQQALKTLLLFLMRGHSEVS